MRFVVFCVIGAVMLTAQHRVAGAQEIEYGMRDFMTRCAVCHGPRAEGNGPLAEFLTIETGDLRYLAANNEGVFPFQRVYEIIDGRQDVRAHGSTQMPVWGDYFTAEAVQRQLPTGFDPEEIVHGRILSIVFYLQAIQRSEGEK